MTAAGDDGSCLWLHFTRLDRMLRDSVHIYIVPITDIAALGRWAHLVVSEESPLNTIVSASGSESQPSSSLIHAHFLRRVREGAEREGERKVGSDHSAAISLKKQLVQCIEAAVGCDTWIRTSLVIDCTAVLSLSLYSPFLLFTSHLWNGKSIWTEGRRVFVPTHLKQGEITNRHKYVNIYEGF